MFNRIRYNKTDEIFESTGCDFGIDLTIISRDSYDCRIIDVPPLNNEDMLSFLEHRAKSFYPGKDEDMAFDFTIQKEKAVLTIMSAKQKDEISGSDIDCYCLHSCIKVKEPNSLYLISFNDFIEVLVYENSQLIRNSIIRKGPDLKSNILSIEKSLIDFARYCTEDLNSLVAYYSNDIDFIKPRYNSLFNNVKPVLFKNRSFRFAVYGLLALGILGFSIVSNIVSRQETLKKLEAEGLELSNIVFRLQDSETAHLELQDKIELIQKKLPVDSYLFLQNLTTALGRDVNIVSLNLQGKFFTAELISDRSLQRLELLKSSPLFVNVTESRVIPLNNGKDKYTLSGEYNAY